MVDDAAERYRPAGWWTGRRLVDEEPLWWPVQRLLDAYRGGSLSPVEVCELAQARIAGINPTLHAFGHEVSLAEPDLGGWEEIFGPLVLAEEGERRGHLLRGPHELTWYHRRSLSPMQQSFHDHHALQCGFCTAGILMTLESVNPDDWREPEQIVELLSGNLCRCTGYQNIVAAVAHAWNSPQSSPAQAAPARSEAEAASESGDARP